VIVDRPSSRNSIFGTSPICFGPVGNFTVSPSSASGVLSTVAINRLKASSAALMMASSESGAAGGFPGGVDQSKPVVSAFSPSACSITNNQATSRAVKERGPGADPACPVDTLAAPSASWSSRA
jgi:hypothetical protein